MHGHLPVAELSEYLTQYHSGTEISVAAKRFPVEPGAGDSWELELAGPAKGGRTIAGKGRMQTRGNQRKYCFEVFAGSLKGSALDGKENIERLSMLRRE